MVPAYSSVYFYFWNIFQNLDWASSSNPFFSAEKFCLNLWFRISIHLCHLTLKFFLYPVKSLWIYFVSHPAFLYPLLFCSVYVSNTLELRKEQNYIWEYRNVQLLRLSFGMHRYIVGFFQTIFTVIAWSAWLIIIECFLATISSGMG